jgi:catechol 2,3-dioxygenase-like lactoylglutathione lyase family enzyme
MYIDHVGINTNNMEATMQFYCGILGMRLVRTTRTPDGRRHYNVDIGGGNAFAVFDGAELPMAGERQHVNHLALPVDTIIIPSVTGVEWSIPLSLILSPRVSILSGVGAGPPPDGVR